MKKLVLVVPSVDEDKLKINKCYLKVLDNYNVKYVISSYNLNILKVLDLFNGVLLTGGGDFSIKYVKENLHNKSNNIFQERDEFEIELIKKCYNKKIPTLGICRGAQCINIALGGTICQHIENHIQSQPKNIQNHYINIKKDSKLYNILKKEKIGVNSFHHQIIQKVSNKLICCAKAQDGTIEAIETKENFFFLGVQWHPECLDNLESKKLFQEFINNIRR